MPASPLRGLRGSQGIVVSSTRKRDSMPKKMPYYRKRLGQIFLRDPLVVEQIFQSAALTPQDTVLEIGPGRGILTAALARRTQALYAIEIDAHYARTLQPHFA